MSATGLFLAVGGLAMVAGIATMVVAIRGGPGTNPKSTAMLIAGMMACAFGMLLAAFAIGSQPLEAAR
jgi:uncharacterized membrane protein HdeD (DUF308 family)